MKRQSILAVLLMSCIVCGVILGRNDKMEAKTEETEREFSYANLSMSEIIRGTAH